MALRQPESSPQPPESRGDAAVRLLALVEHDPELALRLIAVLEETGIADSVFVRTERVRLNLARGDRGTLIDHGASGADLTPQQAAWLLAEALAGTPVPPAAITNAVSRGLPLSQWAKGQLISAIRASQDRACSVSTFESLCLAAKSADAGARQSIVEMGIELMNKIASTAGERTTRKNWILRAMRASVELLPNSIGPVFESALAREVIYTYDLVNDRVLSQAAVAEESALRQLANRAESIADLTAASSLVARIEEEQLRGRYLRLLFKQFGDQRIPSAEAAKSVLPGLDALVRLHEAGPEKLAASHDEALLGRWAGLFSNLPALQAAAVRIGTARSAHKPATQATAHEAQRLATAISFIKDVVIPNDCRIVAVGGQKTLAAAEAFDEFGKSPPQWGEWITKEKNVPLTSYKIPEQISSPKCVGVLVIVNPAGHALTNQAKVAAEKAGRPLVWIESATKKKIREGMKALVEKIQEGSGKQREPKK